IARSTVAEPTPSTRASTRSTRPAHDTHVIPPTGMRIATRSAPSGGLRAWPPLSRASVDDRGGTGELLEAAAAAFPPADGHQDTGEPDRDPDDGRRERQAARRREQPRDEHRADEPARLAARRHDAAAHPAERGGEKLDAVGGEHAD